jgi:hypothetical protein
MAFHIREDCGGVGWATVMPTCRKWPHRRRCRGNAAGFVEAASPATNQVRADQRRPFGYEQGLLWSARLP